MSIEKACEKCGRPFISFPSDNRRFCSLGCRSAFRFNKETPVVAPGREVIHFSCKECSKNFGMMRSYLDAYRVKHKRDPLYCSRKCSNTGRMKTTTEHSTFNCATCGKLIEKRRKPGGRLYKEQKYCSDSCKYESFKHKALARFERGEMGRHIKRHGYVWISVPSLVTGKRHAMLEHRYVMSKHLGRELHPDETVHHKNGNRQHNTIDNLELFSSRHGPGQRVVDKIAFAIEMLQLYPEFGRAAGYELRALEHPIALPVPEPR